MTHFLKMNCGWKSVLQELMRELLRQGQLEIYCKLDNTVSMKMPYTSGISKKSRKHVLKLCLTDIRSFLVLKYT